MKKSLLSERLKAVEELKKLRLQVLKKELGHWLFWASLVIIIFTVGVQVGISHGRELEQYSPTTVLTK